MYDITPLIQALDDRLHYLLMECPPEDFNKDEIKAIINLQKEYNPNTIPKPIKHIVFGNPQPQQRIIHITSDPPPDPKTIIAVITLITSLTILALIVLFELT